jgi:hypothetical protein
MDFAKSGSNHLIAGPFIAQLIAIAIDIIYSLGVPLLYGTTITDTILTS